MASSESRSQKLQASTPALLPVRTMRGSLDLSLGLNIASCNDQQNTSGDAIRLKPAEQQAEDLTSVINIKQTITEPTALPVIQHTSAMHALNSLQGPSVRVIYSGLSSVSKGILENLIKGWTQWHAHHTDQADGAESGEWTYAAVLAPGTDQPLFWADKPVSILREVEEPASVPLYDRCTDQVLAGVVVSMKRKRESFQRCFNCGSYDHELSSCSRPFNRAVVEANRQTHASTTSQSTAINRKLRYHSEGAGEVVTAAESKFEGLQAGVLSPALREALGLQELEPPPWLARMRMLGLPPGYDDMGEALDGDSNAQACAVDEQVDAPSEGDDFISLEVPLLKPWKLASQTVQLPGMNAPIPHGADMHRWAQAGALILTSEEKPLANITNTAATTTPQLAELEATARQLPTVLDEAEDVDMEVEDEDTLAEETHYSPQLAHEEHSQPTGKTSSLLLESDDVNMEVVDTVDQQSCPSRESLEPPAIMDEPPEPATLRAEAVVTTNAEPSNLNNAGLTQVEDTISPRSSIEHDALAADMPAVAHQARAAFWRVLPQLHTSTRGANEQPAATARTQHVDCSQHAVEHEELDQESYTPLSPHSYIPLSPQTPIDTTYCSEAEQPDVTEQTQYIGNIVDAEPLETGGMHSLPPSDSVPSLLPSLDVCPVNVESITSVSDRDGNTRSKLNREAGMNDRLHRTHSSYSRWHIVEPRREHGRTRAREESISPHRARRAERTQDCHEATEEQQTLTLGSPSGYKYRYTSDCTQGTRYELHASPTHAYSSRREATYVHREVVIRSPRDKEHKLFSPRIRNIQDNEAYYGYHAPRRRDDDFSPRDRRERTTRSRSCNRSPPRARYLPRQFAAQSPR